MELQKNKWRCRECNCEWEVIGEPFTITHVRNIDAGEASECAASELDDREHGRDFNSWQVGEVNGTYRYVEVQIADGEWKRFQVKVRCKVEYEGRETKERRVPR